MRPLRIDDFSHDIKWNIMAFSPASSESHSFTDIDAKASTQSHEQSYLEWMNDDDGRGVHVEYCRQH